MGNFKGHWIPGTGLVIGGVLLMLKAMNVSYLKRLRTAKFFLNLEGLLKIVGGLFGMMLEYSDMGTSYAQSHFDHLGILAVVVVLGLIDLAHINNILRDNIWCLCSPVGYIYIGMKFNAHQQETELRIMAHSVNAYILIAAGVSRALEYLISVHTNKKYHTAVLKKEILHQELRADYMPCWKSILAGIFRCKWFKVPVDDIVLGTNSIYTNPQMYSTIFPQLTGMLILFDGIWWWEMAVTLFHGPINEMMENGHHAMVMLYDMLARDLVIALFCMGGLSIILHYIDQKWYTKEYHNLQLKMTEENPGIEFEFDSSNMELEKLNIE